MPRYQGLIVGPPGWPAHEYMDALSSREMNALDPAYRHLVCRNNPLIFGLTYFPEKMIRDGAIYMNDVHTEMARWGGTWARSDPQPAGNRHAWIAPRGAAKSTWLLNILPLWACVFSHRRFVAMFGISKDAITKTHMRNLVGAIRENDLLRHDYPTFCTPRAGTTATLSEYQSDNGTKIVAAGVNEGYLGMNRDGVRPDVILLDDMDDAAGKFSPEVTADRLATIRQGIFGMNVKADVGWAGTVPVRGSLCDDLVRHCVGELDVEWVRDTQLTTHYYPAIMTDANGRQRSLWPVEWDLGWMLSQRHLSEFQLNFMNRPPSASGIFWEQRHFNYDVPASSQISRLIMWVDPAVTNHEKSDFTGICVAGYAENTRRAIVMKAANIKVTPEGLKRQVGAALRLYYPRGLREIMVEKNNGGEYLRNALSGLEVEFPGIKITLPRSESNRGKPVEFAEAFAHYEKDRVRHSQQFRVAEDQMMVFPHGRNDDCADAVVRAVNVLLAHMPKLASV